MVAWYWLLVTLVAGGLITSAIEYKLKYNLTDEELDLVRSVWNKLTSSERAVFGKISAVKKAL